MNKGQAGKILLGCMVAAGSLGTAEAAVTTADEVVITATKTALGQQAVPSSTAVITRQEIEKMGVQTVREALERVPGLTVNAAGVAGNKVSFRGMGNSGTLILIDGRRQASEDSPQLMNVYELNRMNLSRVERIEVIRGAGSSLYGSDAMGGVINIITRKNRKAGGYVGTELGGRQQDLYAGFSTGKIGKLDLSFDGRINDFRKATNEGYSNFYGPQRFLDITGHYQFDGSRSLEFGASYMREQYHQDTGTGVLPRVSSYAPAMAQPGQNWWYDNNRQSYHMKYNGSDTKNDYFFQVYTDRLGKTEWGNSSDRSSYKTWTAEGKNTYTADAHHTLTYGGEYRYQKADGTRFGSGTVPDGKWNEDLDSYAGYLQDEWKIGDRLLLVPSIRYDHHSSFGAQWSPKAGLTYALSKNTRFKTNYGLGYRAPSIFELYSHTPVNRGGGIAILMDGNSDLKPEKSRDFDMGLETEKGKANGSVTYFHNKVDNFIQTALMRRSRGQLLYQYRNVQKATMDGVEAEVGYAFDKHWSAKAGYTYLDARDARSNERLSGSARNSGSVELSWTDAAPHPWTVSLWNTWYKDYLNEGYIREMNPEGYTYSMTNFTVSKELGRSGRVYAGIDNLFNKKFHSDDLMGLYGRTWRMGWEMKL